MVKPVQIGGDIADVIIVRIQLDRTLPAPDLHIQRRPVLRQTLIAPMHLAGVAGNTVGVV